MTQSVLFPAFAVLMAATALWLVLVWRLFAILRSAAPDVFDSLGRPHVILNNTPSNNLAFLRFLLGGHYANVQNEGVRRLCAFLRAFFWGYLAWFLGLVIAVFLVPVSGI